MSNDGWVASSFDAEGESYKRHTERHLTDGEIRERVAGATVRTAGSHRGLVRLVLTRPGQDLVGVSNAGNSFNLKSLYGKTFLALALVWEIGLSPEELIPVQNILTLSSLMDEMASRAQAGFAIDLEPLAEWALQARTDLQAAGEPPNPFKLTDQELRDLNAGKIFSSEPGDYSLGAGKVYVSVGDGSQRRLLAMPLDDEGNERSDGFGWGYGGQGSFALTIGLLEDLGLGRLEALALTRLVNIGSELREGTWTLPASYLVERVILARHTPETSSPQPITDVWGLV